MVIENYFDSTFPYADLILNYSESLTLACSGVALYALIKKSDNSERSCNFYA